MKHRRAHHKPRRRSLTLRIFLWFGATILVTSLLLTALTAALVLSNPDTMGQERDRWLRFANNRFADAWDDPDRRDAFARAVADDLEIQVTVLDTQGHALSSHGPACKAPTTLLPIIDPDTALPLGTIQVCNPRLRTRNTSVFLSSALALAVALWIGSWLIARRIARPLKRLSHLAERLGGGDLEARAECVDREVTEIASLGRALNDMADRIARQLRDQKTLLAAVSHELRTPLGHMRLLIELGRDEHPELEPHFAELERELLDMDDLVDRVLASSRLDFDLSRALPIDLAAIAAEALRRAGLPTTLLRADPVTPPALGDPNLLRRALTNLLVNAQRHGGGVRALRVEARGEHLVALVCDHGPGLDPAHLAALTEPFVQGARPQDAHPSRDGDGGLGLGLFLVRRIVHAHRGHLLAEPDSAGGCIGLAVPTHHQ